jgi:hypothetical protein
MPDRGGQVLIPVTLGPWDASYEVAREPEPEPEPKSKSKTQPKSKPQPKPEPKPERGKVVIIRDDEPEPVEDTSEPE